MNKQELWNPLQDFPLADEIVGWVIAVGPKNITGIDICGYENPVDSVVVAEVSTLWHKSVYQYIINDRKMKLLCDEFFDLHKWINDIKNFGGVMYYKDPIIKYLCKKQQEVKFKVFDRLEQIADGARELTLFTDINKKLDEFVSNFKSDFPPYSSFVHEFVLYLKNNDMWPYVNTVGDDDDDDDYYDDYDDNETNYKKPKYKIHLLSADEIIDIANKYWDKHNA